MVGALAGAGADVSSVWSRVSGVAAADLPEMGLSAGERPAADVEVLCSAVAVVEYELARRMHAAGVSGALPLVGPGAVPLARGWSAGWARRLASAGGFAADHPDLAAVWSAGVITSEHVWAVGRHADALSPQEMEGVLEELAPLWGQLSPRAVGVFVDRVIRMLHPPGDPEPDEWAAHEARHLSFALTCDSVILSGALPRVEGEVVIAAIDAFADRLRSDADHVPAAARRADALTALVNAAHATGSLPGRGGLPVSLSVTMATTAAGDRAWSTSRGHTLTAAEQRFTSCDALITPIAVQSPSPGCGPSAAASPTGTPAGPEVEARRSGLRHVEGQTVVDSTAASRAADASVGTAAHAVFAAAAGTAVTSAAATAAERISALAATLLGTRIPLAVGRTARTATPAQRRALAARDRGCIIPGCGIPTEACQTHHLHEWATGGTTDTHNLVLLCWAHHRQVDLAMWTIQPTTPGHHIPHPAAGAPISTAWPANNGAPWLITRTPRTRWRL